MELGCSYIMFYRIIQCTCLKIPCNSETAGLRAKRTAISDSGALVNIYGMHLILWGKVICGHSVHLSELDVYSKATCRTTKRTEVQNP